MWLVFLFLILILLIIISSLELNLYQINIYKKKNDFRADLKIKIFGILKLTIIKFDENEIKVLNYRFKYSKFISKKYIQKINEKTINLIKMLNIKFDKIFFTLKIGLIDVTLTNFAIIIFSAVFPNFIKNKVKRENIKYDVFPKYNVFCLNLDGRITISFRILKLIKLYFKNIQIKNEHNKIKNYETKESF